VHAHDPALEPACGVLDVAAEPDADIATLLVALAVAVGVQRGEALVERALVVAGVVGRAGRRLVREVVGRNQVPTPQLCGVHPEFAGRGGD
jgi:hypothetical protein